MNQKNKKPVIMQILPALKSGGVERGTIDLAKALQKNGFESLVVSAGGVMTYQLREAKIKHIELKVDTKNPFNIWCNVDEIADLIAEYKVDIVHVRSRAPMLSAYFACKKTGTKLVSTVHGSYSIGFLGIKKFLPKILYNAMMLRADRVIAVSNFIKEYLLENYQKHFHDPLQDKIDVVARGVDVNYFNRETVSMTRIIELSNKWGLPEDKKIILFPARVTSWKGHEFLIQALTKVQSDFFCVFVGSDHGHKKFRKKMEQKIIKSGLEGKAKFVGTCKDMSVAYALSNLVISASIRPEAFGRIAIEAQAMKKLLIATNIGGSLETVIDGKTGFLVEVGDVEAMAKKIDHALNLDKSSSDAIKNAARKHIEENFSSQKMCESTIKVYQHIWSDEGVAIRE